MTDLQSESNDTCQNGPLSRSPIKIPAVHHFDVHINFMIMRKKIVVMILSPSEDIFALTKSPPQNLGILALPSANISHSFTIGAKEIQMVYWTISK